MKDLTNLTVAEFDDRLRSSLPWITINREAVAQVAADLYAAASHIEQVGWTQQKNFVDPRHPATSACCAVGALHVMTDVGDVYCGVANVVWTFEALTRESLVGFNDYVATDASQVTTYMRHVADEITRYLEATRD